MKSTIYYIKDNSLAIIFSLLYTLLLAFWMKIIPITEAPDEQVHFEANALFIADNNRLPISGIDDLRFITNCRINPLGAMPCTNSYNVFPHLNYVISAISIKLNRIVGAVSDTKAARLPQLLFAFIFCISLFQSAILGKLSKIKALVLALSICLIPQVVFIFSYLNQDAFALTAASVLLLSFLKGYNVVLSGNPLNSRHQIFIGLAFGLLLSSKYNFFSLIPATAIYLVGLLKLGNERQKDKIIKALKIATVAGVIAGPWYIRNLLIYKDILGSGFLLEKMSQFHHLGTARTFTPSNIEFLLDHGWFYINFKSFFGVFGYMSIFLSTFWYITAFILTIFAIGGALYLAGAGIHSKIPIFIAIGTSILVIAMSAYHSLAIDFQAQGRYLFPLLITLFPAAIVLTLEFPRKLLSFFVIWDLFLVAMLFKATLILAARY
jgi:hypothetical protein